MGNRIRVIVTGGGGQLSSELEKCSPEGLQVIVCSPSELNITSRESVRAALEQWKPSIVINCAAYTAVDRAEEEAEKAFLVNKEGVRILAEECRKRNAGIIHISTDFVFDGLTSRPYTINDTPNPISVYGKSKLEGEQILLELYRQSTIVVRTAWLYSIYGKNFVKTMLSLFEKEAIVKVVHDQVGTPTWAFNLASFLWFLAVNFDSYKSRIFHFTDAGVASWYDFAVAIEEESREWRRKPVEIVPVSSAEYPSKAKRPQFSVLDKRDTWRIWNRPVHWRKALRMMLKALKSQYEQ
ncbi:dTDP-4-dehydrorhamnose reductase [Thermodesulforhabdus norvegica]|uniref:dTDP-4-dehydrorhamnose reductase n=1 Tax=Thermodesulforhabdus norvegica TaxID=39841 RepID=A0A1I4UP53_9BACT|nr:dTDP-4-dehydrorhamnose reductase [Thermodesulforhabdus norvegica]SFM90787.1 dTDP-4-dehydrorhamnose reductase [Thermodesulforhabdus norvegica]